MQIVKKTHTETDKQTNYKRQRDGVRERERGFLLVCSCITDVLSSCGLYIPSHVVMRDVSMSLPGLLRCHISPSLKYVPAKTHSDAKIKKR